MNRASSRRVLVVLAGVLLAVLLVLDLARPNSLVRSIWGGNNTTRQQEVIREMNRRGLPVTPP